MELFQRLIVKIHDNTACTELIAFLHDHLYELRLIQPGGDKDLLAFLHIRARPGNEFRVFPQSCFLHGSVSPCFFVSAEYLLPAQPFSA